MKTLHLTLSEVWQGQHIAVDMQLCPDLEADSVLGLQDAINRAYAEMERSLESFKREGGKPLPLP